MHLRQSNINTTAPSPWVDNLAPRCVGNQIQQLNTKHIQAYWKCAKLGKGTKLCGSAQASCATALGSPLEASSQTPCWDSLAFGPVSNGQEALDQKQQHMQPSCLHALGNQLDFKSACAMLSEHPALMPTAWDRLTTP